MNWVRVLPRKSGQILFSGSSAAPGKVSTVKLSRTAGMVHFRSSNGLRGFALPRREGPQPYCKQVIRKLHPRQHALLQDCAGHSCHNARQSARR